MDAIFKRVSIRKYADRDVEQEKIEKILRAAMQAPSAGNQQPWEFIVVKDKELLKQLGTISEYAWPATEAPCAIVNICNPENCKFANVAPTDMAICTEHEWLEASDLGLGAVWLGVYPFEERINKGREILGLQGEKFIFSILTLGYPAQERLQKARFRPEKISYR